MARRAGSDSSERRTLRLFSHPQRGTMLAEEPVPPGCRRYRGGKDSEWREVAVVEVVAVNGSLPDARLSRARLGWRIPGGSRGQLASARVVIGGFGPLDPLGAGATRICCSDMRTSKSNFSRK
jgi:hypothetical protein